MNRTISSETTQKVGQDNQEELNSLEEQDSAESEPVIPRKSFWKRFWCPGLVIIALIVGGYFIYAETAIFYPTVTEVVFEKENISDEPFNDLLLKTEQLAKEWAPDAKLKWVRFHIPENSYYASYEILYISQSKKIQTDDDIKPGILDIRYNCQPYLETNKIMKLKGHGCEPTYNNKLVALFCHGGKICDQIPSYILKDNIIDIIKISGLEAYEKTLGKSKMGILTTEDDSIYWLMGWGYNIDAVTGEVTMRDENIEKDDLDNKEGQDSDNDGLTDIKEAEYGTDPDNPDSDGDGYKDGDEINNGYDPLINEKATQQDNKTTYDSTTAGWKVYKSEHCNCSFNYPPSWIIEDKYMHNDKGWISVFTDEYYQYTTIPIKEVTVNNFTNVFDGSKSLIERLDSYFKERYEKYEILDYFNNQNVVIKKVKTYAPDGSPSVDLYFDALNGKTMLINKSNGKISWEEDEEIKNIISSIKLIKN